MVLYQVPRSLPEALPRDRGAPSLMIPSEGPALGCGVLATGSAAGRVCHKPPRVLGRPRTSAPAGPPSSTLGSGSWALIPALPPTPLCPLRMRTAGRGPEGELGTEAWPGARCWNCCDTLLWGEAPTWVTLHEAVGASGREGRRRRGADLFPKRPRV